LGFAFSDDPGGLTFSTVLAAGSGIDLGGDDDVID
jgi:hypothetical protein